MSSAFEHPNILKTDLFKILSSIRRVDLAS